MEQITRFYDIGRQLKRTFIAFILSCYVAFLQIWLSFELFKLAQEFERVARNHRIKEFRKTSKLLLGARVAACIAFILSVITLATSFVSTHTFFYGPYDYILVMPLIQIIPIIIELGILSAAWKNIYRFFEHDESLSAQTRFLGLKGTSKVRWALAVTIVAMIIRYITSGTNIYDFFNHYFSYSSYSYLVPSLLSLVGLILILLGTINAGVGMYETSKTFLNFKEINEKRPHTEQLLERVTRARESRDAYKELPFHPDNLAPTKKSTAQDVNALISENSYTEVPDNRRKGKYCFNCGTELPEVSGLRFCPNCGIRVN